MTRRPSSSPFPDAQAIIQGSWNWPNHRKDLEIFGTHGYVSAPDGKSVRMRLPGQQTDQTVTPKELPEQCNDGFAYLAAVVCGT
jgi:scyllo-inositol 2-dehydrogenase (NADP+)